MEPSQFCQHCFHNRTDFHMDKSSSVIFLRNYIICLIQGYDRLHQVNLRRDRLGLVRFGSFILVENIYTKICDTKKNVMESLFLLMEMRFKYKAEHNSRPFPF